MKFAHLCITVTAVLLGTQACTHHGNGGLGTQAAVVRTQDVNAELRALYGEVVRRMNDRQYDQRTSELAQQMLRVAERDSGPESDNAAASHALLASLYKLQGQVAQAERSHESALAIMERNPGRHSSAMSSELTELAVLHYERRNFTKAEALFERALAIRERTLRTDDPLLASSVQNVAAASMAQGAYAKAVSLYERALAIREKRTDAYPFDIAKVLNSLAQAYRLQGERAKAEAPAVRAIALLEKSLGSVHQSQLADSLRNLANDYRARGEPAKAVPLLARELAIHQKTLAPDHPTVLASRRLLEESGQKAGESGGNPSAGASSAPAASAIAASRTAGGRLSSQACEAMKQSVIATRVPPNASVTAAMETVMFMTKTELDMIDGGCPTEPGVTPAQIAAARKERQQQFATAEQNCNAVQSGGRRCLPQAHTAAAAVSKPPVASAGQSEQRQRTISYDPVTGRCIGDREMCACQPGIGAGGEYGECPSSRRSSGGGIRTAR